MSRLTMQAIETLIDQLSFDDKQELEGRIEQNLMNQLFEVTFIINEGNYDQEEEKFGVVRATNRDAAINYLSTNYAFKAWVIDTFGVYGDEEDPCPACGSNTKHFHRIQHLTTDEMVKAIKK